MIASKRFHFFTSIFKVDRLSYYNCCILLNSKDARSLLHVVEDGKDGMISKHICNKCNNDMRD
jgi:hypothetical protein